MEKSRSMAKVGSAMKKIQDSLSSSLFRPKAKHDGECHENIKGDQLESEIIYMTLVSEIITFYHTRLL